eukprot:195529-Chlamydomonas_euryale.AAC.4
MHRWGRSRSRGGGPRYGRGRVLWTGGLIKSVSGGVECGAGGGGRARRASPFIVRPQLNCGARRMPHPAV